MKLKFGNVEENVVTREEFPLEKAKEVLKDEVIAVIGYGVQGPGKRSTFGTTAFMSSSASQKRSKGTGTVRSKTAGSPA